MKALMLLVVAVMLLPVFVPVSVFAQDDADETEKTDKSHGRGNHGDRPPMERLQGKGRGGSEGGSKGRQNGGEDSRGRADRIREFIKQRRMREQDPETQKGIKEIRDVENECKKLAMQYRKAETEEEKQQIKEELEAAVSKVFDLRIVIQQKEVERLEKRLQELKKLLAKRVQAREEVIDMRLNKLTGETKHLEW